MFIEVTSFETDKKVVINADRITGFTAAANGGTSIRTIDIEEFEVYDSYKAISSTLKVTIPWTS